jgi:hypothetical protein
MVPRMHAGAAGNAGDRAEVRGEGADGRLAVEHGDEVAEGAGRERRPWGDAERFCEAGAALVETGGTPVH